MASAARYRSGSTTTSSPGSHRAGILLRARGRAAPGSRTTQGAAPEGRSDLPENLLVDAPGSDRPSTRSARTSVAACRSACRASGSSAAVTVRSTTASARRRAGPPRAAWTTSRSSSQRRVTSRSTPAPSSRAGRSAPTPPARRPRVRTASELRALMFALTTTSIAWLIFTIILVGWIVVLLPEHPVGARRVRLGDRARRRTASRTTTTRRSKARGSTACSAWASCCWRSPSSRCRSTGSSSPTVRPARSRPRTSISRSGARRCSRPPPTAASTAPDATARTAPAACARTTSRTQPTGEVRAVTWTAPALNTIFYRFSEDEVRYILVYGRPFSPMSPWGVDGGGPMNDQQIDTLHRLPEASRSSAKAVPRARKIKPLCASGHLPDRRRRRRSMPPRRRPSKTATRAYVRRGALRAERRQRRVQLRPLPHPWLELRRARRRRPGRARLEPHRRSRRRTSRTRRT